MASRGRGRGISKRTPVGTPLSSTNVHPVCPVLPPLPSGALSIPFKSEVIPTEAAKPSPLRISFPPKNPNPFIHPDPRENPFTHPRRDTFVNSPPHVVKQKPTTPQISRFPPKQSNPFIHPDPSQPPFTNPTGNMGNNLPPEVVGQIKPVFEPTSWNKLSFVRKNENGANSFSTYTKYPTDFAENSHGIRTNKEILCISGAIHNPSEFYLAKAPDCLERIRNMSDKLTTFYNVASRVELRYRYVPRRSDILSGLMVAVCIPQKEGDKQWFRGRILSKADDPDSPHVLKFNVELVDNGGQIAVLEESVFHLDNRFHSDSHVAIKCRLALNRNFDRLHSGQIAWPKQVGSQMISVLYGRQFLVKFHRRKFHRGDFVWEVSLLRYKDAMGPFAIDFIISQVADKLNFPFP